MEPANADALHLLGVIAYQSGQHHAALELIGQALVIRPQDASFHYNRGLVLYDLNWPEEAAVCFREALRLQPDYPEAYNNLDRRFKKVEQGLLVAGNIAMPEIDYSEVNNFGGLESEDSVDDCVEHRSFFLSGGAPQI